MGKAFRQRIDKADRLVRQVHKPVLAGGPASCQEQLVLLAEAAVEALCAIAEMTGGER